MLILSFLHSSPEFFSKELISCQVQTGIPCKTHDESLFLLNFQLLDGSRYNNCVQWWSVNHFFFLFFFFNNFGLMNLYLFKVFIISILFDNRIDSNYTSRSSSKQTSVSFWFYSSSLWALPSLWHIQKWQAHLTFPGPSPFQPHL